MPDVNRARQIVKARWRFRFFVVPMLVECGVCRSLVPNNRVSRDLHMDWDLGHLSDDEIRRLAQ